MASEEYNRRLKAQGVISIRPEEGIETLKRVLANNINQVMPIKIDQKLFLPMGIDVRHRMNLYPVIQPPVFNGIKEDIRALTVNEENIFKLKKAFEMLDRMSEYLLLGSFRRMGVFKNGGECYDKGQLKELLRIQANYERLFDALIDILAGAGFIKHENNVIICSAELDSANLKDRLKGLEKERESLKKLYPEIDAHINLIWECVGSYPEVLTGRKSHIEVMFPSGSKSLVENIYKGNDSADYHNTLVAGIVKSYVKKRLEEKPGEKVKILEIGAGTGGTSIFVLDAIKELGAKVCYYYTDISAGFTQHGRKIFGEKYPFVEFRVLDIENKSERQGFDVGSIDLVFGSNVFHATRKIYNTLNQAKKLMKSNGMIVINEVTKVQNFTTLTFGMTEGWWLFEDEKLRMPGSPLLSPDGWKRVLAFNGFKNIKLFGFSDVTEDKLAQSVIVGESDGVVVSEIQEENSVAADTAVRQKTVSMIDKSDMNEAKTLKVGVNTVNTSNFNEKVLDYVKEVFSEILKIRKNEIESGATFEKYGVDSLIILEINKRFGKDFGKLPSTLLFEYNTAQALAHYFLVNHRQNVEQMLGNSETYVVENSEDLFKQEPVGSKEIFDNYETGDKDACASLELDEQSGSTDLPVKHESIGDIAVIGLSGKYPGSENVNILWDNLKSGRSMITEIPKDRWDWEKYYSVESGKQGKSTSKWGGFIKDADKFDPLFFQITPREAEDMDPQERVFMETVWELFEDAGVTRHDFNAVNKKVGVFVGIMNNDYVRAGGNSSYWSIANRISYYYDLQGPSLALDTACSSSLTAVHLACESIRRGECKMAVAGGVNLILHPLHYVNLSKMNMLSKNGKCSTFGEDADGFVDGEGSGAVLLKPLNMAIADKDNIYAVIKGSSINAGGKTGGYTVPNPNAQSDLIADAIINSGVNPRTISYVEAHGTGTSLGDPLEIRGLARAFGTGPEDSQYCAIGSIKSNIGHLESAAGIAGLTKVLLQMKYKKLVPSINCERLNTNIEFNNSPFYVQRALEEWKRPVIVENGAERVYPRRAGVSSFGAGGANAHVILEEYDKGEDRNYSQGDVPNVIVLSAKDEERLMDYARVICDYLKSRICYKAGEETEDCVDITDLAYTLQAGREPMEERLSFVAFNLVEVYEKLVQYCQNAKECTGIFRGNTRKCKSKLAALTENGETSSHADELINNRKLEKLSELWVYGAHIDWRLLYVPLLQPKRISMPAYPFARERYWTNNNANMERAGAESISKLHSLIDSNESTLDEQCYKKVICEKDFFIRDHVIQGELMMPGVAYIEMARMAGELASPGKKVGRFRNIVWSKKIVLDNVPVEVFVHLYPNDTSIEYEVSTASEGGRLIHTTGKVLYGNPEKDRIESGRLDITLIKSTCRNSKTGDQCYSEFAESGIEYGPGFKVINELYFTENEALAELSLPGEFEGSLDDFVLHPSLMDGALQAVMGFTSGIEDTSGRIYLPYAIDEIEIAGSLDEAAYAYVTYSKGIRNDSDSRDFDILILNKAGEVLIKIKGFSVKALQKTVNADDEVRELFKKLADGELDVKDVEQLMEGIYDER